jgi:hypothetical protein
MVLKATFNRGKRKSASTRRSQSLSPLKSTCHPVEDVLFINHYVTLVCQLVPTCVLQVLGSSTNKTDRQDRAEIFLKSGVKHP